MNRLIEKTVFSGFVTAWRLATWPTRISPSLVKATTEGVMRLPSWLGMTRGSPPSITATTELVVPRSMPITFPMLSSLGARPSGRARLGGESCLDRDAARAGARLHLREDDGQHAVLDAGLRPVERRARAAAARCGRSAVARLCDTLSLRGLRSPRRFSPRMVRPSGVIVKVECRRARARGPRRSRPARRRSPARPRTACGEARRVLRHSRGSPMTRSNQRSRSSRSASASARRGGSRRSPRHGSSAVTLSMMPIVVLLFTRSWV